MTEPLYRSSDDEQQLQQAADALLSTAAGLNLHWLDLIYLFGVLARGLTNTAPGPVGVAERDALHAYMQGNKVKIGLKHD